MTPDFHVHSANLPSFSIVPVMPLPISAALLANSDLATFLGPLTSPFGEPFATLLCDPVRRDCRCEPTFVEDSCFCACAKTALNSGVRSCMEVVVIFCNSGTPAIKMIVFLHYLVLKNMDLGGNPAKVFVCQILLDAVLAVTGVPEQKVYVEYRYRDATEFEDATFLYFWFGHNNSTLCLQRD